MFRRVLFATLIFISFIGLFVYFSQEKIRTQGFIVNHHLLVAQFIEEQFELAKNENPKVVVLISPNHFGVGIGNFQTSKRVWDTKYGLLEPVEASKSIDNLLRVNEKTFDHEHGIYNIIPYIKKTFPHARVLPIAIKETASEKDIVALAEQLHRSLPRETLFVGSFDFSHELPPTVAQFHDHMSSAAIHSFDYASVANLDIDSRAGLRLLLDVMQRRGAQKFVQSQNTNSATRAGQVWNADDTSYITGAFLFGPPTPSDIVTILVLPRESDAAFSEMPRLLSGQYFLVHEGDRVTDEQQARVGTFGHSIEADVWHTDHSQALAITITRQNVKYDQIYLQRRDGKFFWPNEREYDMLSATKKINSPFIK